MRKFGSGRGRRGKGKPSLVDAHVGARVRMRRAFLWMSQTGLGDALGVSYQQVQKYERGTNRIGSSRLYDLARALDVPVGYFFEEMPTAVAASSPATKRRGRAEEPASYELNPMAERETLEFVRAYCKIRDPQIRKRVCELAKALGAASRKRAKA